VAFISSSPLVSTSSASRLVQTHLLSSFLRALLLLILSKRLLPHEPWWFLGFLLPQSPSTPCACLHPLAVTLLGTHLPSFQISLHPTPLPFSVLGLRLILHPLSGPTQQFLSHPRLVLTVSPSSTSPGDSVTLTCSVEPPSAGWRFFWYKAVPQLSRYYTHELLAGGTTGTEQDSYILHGQTHTAGYVCRAGRGDPVSYTEYSYVKFVWSGGVNPAASLTVSPHRLQHFSTESLSLICEGNSAEWRVMKVDEDGDVSSCYYWGEMTGSTCNTDTRASSGVYWCESETQFSNAANITIHSGDVILVSPVRPVTEGHFVTLG
uniref:Ig-like domain-containing protein n=1 Tax=Gasterosteus aculeatus aculeatus TaxID=481459 RepID=A0AAQ4PHT1_GASAC